MQEITVLTDSRLIKFQSTMRRKISLMYYEVSCLTNMMATPFFKNEISRWENYQYCRREPLQPIIASVLQKQHNGLPKGGTY